MEPPKISKLLPSLVVILLFLAIIAAADIYRNAEIERAQVCEEMRSELVTNAFSPLAISVQGKAFYIYDFTKNEPLDGKNEDTVLPLASLTKLMTIRLALEHDSSPLEFYTVKPSDLTSDGYAGFIPGDSYRVEDLIQAALVESINDAAVMLAASTGVNTQDFYLMMDLEAKELGLSSLHYESVTGLDDASGQATAFGSAHDILTLLDKDYADFPVYFTGSTAETAVIHSSDGRAITLVNTDLAIPNLPFLVVSKTGYTDAAGGNLAVLWREPGGDLLGASLLGSTQKGRFSDMIAIYEAANGYVASLKAIPAACAVP